MNHQAFLNLTPTAAAQVSECDEVEIVAQSAAESQFDAAMTKAITLAPANKAAVPVKAHAYAFSMARRPESGEGWIAKIFEDGTEIKIVRADSERKCNVEVSNWIYREKHGMSHLAAKVATATSIELATARRAWRKAAA